MTSRGVIRGMVSKPSSSSTCLAPFSAKLLPNFTMAPRPRLRLQGAARSPRGAHRGPRSPAPASPGRGGGRGRAGCSGCSGCSVFTDSGPADGSAGRPGEGAGRCLCPRVYASRVLAPQRPETPSRLGRPATPEPAPTGRARPSPAAPLTAPAPAAPAPAAPRSDPLCAPRPALLAAMAEAARAAARERAFGLGRPLPSLPSLPPPSPPLPGVQCAGECARVAGRPPP